jgi:hypothetical protein
MNLEYVRAVFSNGDIYSWSTGSGYTITMDDNQVLIEKDEEVTSLELICIPMVSYKVQPE